MSLLPMLSNKNGTTIYHGTLPRRVMVAPAPSVNPVTSNGLRVSRILGLVAIAHVSVVCMRHGRVACGPDTTGPLRERGPCHPEGYHSPQGSGRAGARVSDSCSTTPCRPVSSRRCLSHRLRPGIGGQVVGPA